MTKGEAIVDIMNATGYDIAIPGNHEFDYGFFQDETGDGFTMFRQADVLEESDAADSEALLEYITVTLNSLVGEAYADPYGQGCMVTVGDQAG